MAEYDSDDNPVRQFDDPTRNTELRRALREINGQDAYNVVTASLGKLNREKYLVLPSNVNLGEVQPANVGRSNTRAIPDAATAAAIYVLNREVCDDEADRIMFGLVRMECVSLGWFDSSSCTEYRYEDFPDDPLTTLQEDLNDDYSKISDAKKIAFLQPFFAEHTFRTYGHHYITGMASEYNDKYRKLYESCLYPALARAMKPDNQFYDCMHWVGPGRVWRVLNAQADQGTIPNAVVIRKKSAPSGTALIASSSAVCDSMASAGILDELSKVCELDLDGMMRCSDAIKDNPAKYHQAYFAYGVPPLLEDERVNFENYLKVAKAFAPLAQAFIDIYHDDGSLGGAKVLKRHADDNAIIYKRSSTFFRALSKRKITDLKDLYTVHLGS